MNIFMNKKKKFIVYFLVTMLVVNVFAFMENNNTKLQISKAQELFSLTGEAHVQSFGDTPGTYNPATGILTLGTTGKGKRLEQMTLHLVNNTSYEGSIEYRVHRQTYGWTNWVPNGRPAGTTGESKRLEAFQIRLTGELAEHYDVYYRTHCQTYGWLAWAKNGELAGTSGLAKRMEAMEIKLVAKGDKAPGNQGISHVGYAKSSKDFNGTEGKINYFCHVQTYGNQGYVSDGSIAGTTGEAKRLEQITIKLGDTGYEGGVTYRTHVQTFGWLPFVKDGEESGTSGLAKRLEAIEISLYGEVANYYDVYYRVHSQTFGWLGWAKNGATSGTVGRSKRLEAIQIVLVPKGGAAPAGSGKKAYIDYSMNDLLEKSLLPVGKTMYIWGGGWNEADDGSGIEAVTIGVSPRWEEFASKQDASYDYKKTRYQIHDGLDCSGYIGWLMYNVMNDTDGNQGYVMGANVQAKTFASYGWGALLKSNDWKPGDVCSMSGHVWLCLGSCPDGSVLLVHSSPPGVRICGTRLANGKDSQAVALATEVMKTYYPEWYAKYPACSVSNSYLTTAEKLRWGNKVLLDPDGLQNKNAYEIVDYLFKKK